MPEIIVPGNSDLAELVAILAEGLRARNWKMTTAESCTGGWTAKLCTDLAGSSAWFERGYVTYSNAAKQDMLGVDEATLEHAGAVSQQVALQMAEGAINGANVDMAVAITGIAGPDGGTLEKPVGTVWFGFALVGFTEAEVRVFEGKRDAVRRQAVAHALQGLINRLAP